MFNLSVPWWELIVRSLLIYAVFFVGLRLFGKREIGQFTVFDLVLLLLVANALQPAMTGPDSSVTGGIIIILTLLLINRGLALVRARFPVIDDLINPQPTVIASNGQWNDAGIKKEDLSMEDVQMALREHGVTDVKDVKLACLEEDGSISVVTNDSPSTIRRRRRIRFLRHN